MSKLSKNMKAALAKFDQTKQYELAEACGILKEVTYIKKQVVSFKYKITK